MIQVKPVTKQYPTHAQGRHSSVGQSGLAPNFYKRRSIQAYDNVLVRQYGILAN